MKGTSAKQNILTPVFADFVRQKDMHGGHVVKVVQASWDSVYEKAEKAFWWVLKAPRCEFRSQRPAKCVQHSIVVHEKHGEVICAGCVYSEVIPVMFPC